VLAFQLGEPPPQGLDNVVVVVVHASRNFTQQRMAGQEGTRNPVYNNDSMAFGGVPC
jgi:hypothetical protein